MAYCDDCGRHLNCDMESAEVKGCVFKEDRAGWPSSVAPSWGATDRIKLTTKGGQSIPALKGVSRLNMDLIEAEANRQLQGKLKAIKAELKVVVLNGIVMVAEDDFEVIFASYKKE